MSSSKPVAVPDTEPDYFSKQIQRANRFYRHLDNQSPVSGLDFRVVAGGRETCSPGYLVSRGTFQYHAIEFVNRGRGTLVLGGVSRDLTPGTVFSYGPGIPHEIRNDGAEPLEKYFVNITGERAAYLLEGEISLMGKVLHTSAPHALIQTFEEITQYGLDSSPWSDRLCSRLVEVLVYKIARTAMVHGESGSTAFATFRRCRNFIDTQYREYRNLESLADACGMDPAYLCRLFRKFDNQSPYQYLLRLQMNHAAERLLEAGLQVQEVAWELGYEDPLHFSRTFKRVIGVSPAELIRLSRT